MDDGINMNWRRAVVVLLVVMALSVAGLAFMGTNVSRILSTVGASVGPGVAVPNEPDPNVGVDGGSDGDRDADPGSKPAVIGGGSEAFQDLSRPDLLIIRTGSITIRVPDLDAGLASAGSAITRLGGYESGSQRSGDGDAARAEVTYRFPASGWQSAVVAIRGIGQAVLAEQSQTVDVSGEVVDTDARIRNLQVTEAALQSIMDRAGGIQDVLDVQARLSDVRGEIEELSSKVATLREQAAMSTLVVSFVLPETPVVAQQEARFDPSRESEAATARLVELLQSLATAGIWFAIVWLPVLLAIAIAGGVALMVARWLRARLTTVDSTKVAVS